MVEGRGQERGSIVLCTQMRSGSWMLSDLCQQTGLLGQPEEYFRPDFRHHWSGEWGLDTRRSYAEYITSAIGLTSTPNGMFGVKMHAYQMNWFLRQLRQIWGSDAEAEPVDLLGRWLPSPSFVHLKRRDVARQAISYHRAIRSTVWFEMRNDGSAEDLPTERALPPEEPAWGEIRYLENGLIGQERMWTTFFETNEIERLELIYEEVSDDQAGALEAIFEFLDIEGPEHLAIESRLKKQADDVTERWYEQYLLHRDSVEPIPPRRPGSNDSESDGPGQARFPNSTSAPITYADKARPAELTPADYIAKRASWAQLVASLVISGLSVGAAAMLVDALPGEGAEVTKRVTNSDWRKGLTPLPPQSPDPQESR